MAAAARPYWTGFLKLSLVTIAVRLYSATTEKEHIQAALKELIDEKLAGQLPERPLERKPAQVIDLMDALKRSLAEEGAEKTGDKARPRSAKSSKAQPNLLLPVRGGLADQPTGSPSRC
jgi:DNA end-binding protein Ku